MKFVQVENVAHRWYASIGTIMLVNLLNEIDPADKQNVVRRNSSLSCTNRKVYKQDLDHQLTSSSKPFPRNGHHQ